MKEIFPDTRPLDVLFRPIRPKFAPALDFELDQPEGCLGVCLGSCHDGPCPFLGCEVNASAFGPASTRH